MLIDTHSHLFKEYYNSIDEVANNMNGLIITAGVNDETNLEVINIVSKYLNVYGNIGIQPEEINNITENSFKIIEDNINNPKIVGIGEIGLDYHYTKENKEKQIEVFKRQLDLARKYHKPVVIHSRDAALDTYEILSEYKDLKKIMHCFSYSIEMAKRFIDIGCVLGIGGALTFKNNKKLTEVVQNIDIKYFVLETDSPYMSPEPFRGKVNVPSNIYYVALKIAELKKISVEETLEIIGQTTVSQFDFSDKIW